MTADAPRSTDGNARTPFDALGVLASQDVTVAAGLRHLELYTMGGLLTLLWHEPGDDDRRRPAAMVLCGGAMGGLLGPAGGMYHRLGVEWAARGVPVLRVSYRQAGDLEACCLDVAATVQLAVGAGAERVVVMGHSFGGAVAVRVGVGLRSVGHRHRHVRHAIGRMRGRRRARRDAAPAVPRRARRDPPAHASEMVQMIAGTGELVRLPGDGHLLAKSADAVWERLEDWLPAVLD